MNTNKSYLTPSEVAELLMVTPTAVRLWAEKGELNALSTPGGHRRFRPMDVEAFARKRGLVLNLRETGPLRLLIVDDDEQLGRYLVALFRGFKDEINVEVVSDSFEAGLKINEFKPDVVLLDLMMPGLDGFQVCKLLKTGLVTNAIRVIAMTGYPSQENVAKILSAGAEVCLSKPIDEDELFINLGLVKLVDEVQ